MIQLLIKLQLHLCILAIVTPTGSGVVSMAHGPYSRDRNQWSFDMFFAQESFKNALFLMILVCMDRAQSEELGTLYFYRCQMYIS